MADDTDTTRPGETEAVEAAARVLAHGLGWREPAQLHTDAAEEIVARVYPVIAAAVREQAAQDIEAAWSECEEWHAMHREPYTYGSAAAFAEHAVRLVRGGR